MTDYVVPSGVRIADADRVRLGAHLATGTTVMHEGFVNFNAGTLGTSMVEGRITAGCGRRRRLRHRRRLVDHGHALRRRQGDGLDRGALPARERTPASASRSATSASSRPGSTSRPGHRRHAARRRDGQGGRAVRAVRPAVPPQLADRRGRGRRPDRLVGRAERRPSTRTDRMAPMAGFSPPPYPYDRLDGSGRWPPRLPGRAVDLSIGTPVRPAARRRRRRPRRLGHRTGLPAVDRHRRRSARPPAGGCDRRLGVDVARAAVAAMHRHEGAGRRRAALAAPAHARPRHGAVPARSATRATRWAPRWPGAGRAGAGRRPRGASISTPIDRGRRRPRPVPLGQHARQPGRRSRRPRRGGRLGPGARRAGALRRVLRRVHLGRPRRTRSSSTGPTACWPCTRCRSARTWPAPGSASTPATPSSSRTCHEVRKHAGFMVPGPVQAAAVAALGRRRPRRRAARRATASGSNAWPTSSDRGWGSTRHCPAAASTSGSPAPDGDAWALARRLADRGRCPGQPGRVLRRSRRRPRAAGDGPTARTHRPHRRSAGVHSRRALIGENGVVTYPTPQGGPSKTGYVIGTILLVLGVGGGILAIDSRIARRRSPSGQLPARPGRRIERDHLVLEGRAVQRVLRATWHRQAQRASRPSRSELIGPDDQKSLTLRHRSDGRPTRTTTSVVTKAFASRVRPSPSPVSTTCASWASRRAPPRTRSRSARAPSTSCSAACSAGSSAAD